MQTFPLLCLLTLWLAPNTPQATPSATPVMSAPTCGRSTAAVSGPAETFTMGTLRVERYGDHGRPVILIPGLASGSWVWTDTVEHLRADHVVYALTLAGFDGVPPPKKKTGLLDQADAALLKLIKSRSIDHPVLVGHSLGGTLAIRFAGEHSDLLAGVMAVDGLPVFPGMQDMTAAQRQARAKTMQARMANATPAQFKAQQLGYMKYMGVIDPDQAACYAKLTARSDPAATAEYMAEDFAADYRPGLKNITVPLLEVSPYYAPDFKQAAARSGKPVMSAEDKAAYYRRLLGGDAEAKVVTIAPSRHFVMLDQPQEFLRVLDRFLSRLPKIESHD